jgi:hypothetical protein
MKEYDILVSNRIHETYRVTEDDWEISRTALLAEGKKNPSNIEIAARLFSMLDMIPFREESMDRNLCQVQIV